MFGFCRVVQGEALATTGRNVANGRSESWEWDALHKRTNRTLSYTAYMHTLPNCNITDDGPCQQIFHHRFSRKARHPIVVVVPDICSMLNESKPNRPWYNTKQAITVLPTRTKTATEQRSEKFHGSRSITNDSNKYSDDKNRATNSQGA